MENNNSHSTKNSLNDLFNQKNVMAFGSLAVLLIFLLLIGGVYYWVSKKAKGQVVFPAGVNYLGPQGDQNLQPVPTVDMSQVGKSGKWLAITGKIYKYKFVYPAELQVTAFINDPSDKLAWVTGSASPQQNIVVNVESLTGADEKYIGNPEEYAKNYWKKFSGLAGVKSVEPFKNVNGLQGFKAVYFDKSGKINITHYFLPIPNDSIHLLQIINGIVPEDVFAKIMNGIEFTQ